jgi:hypothetical protein
MVYEIILLHDTLQVTEHCLNAVLMVLLFGFFGLKQIGPNSIQLLRRLLAKIDQSQVGMLRFIACNEIFLMPSFIFLILM